MATSSAVIDTLTKATGIRQTTVGHTVRLLREGSDDLWPKSGKGGGKSARHVEEGHLANLVLALAGAQPSDAVDVTTRLGAARWVGEGRAARAGSPYALSARALLALRQGRQPSRDLDLHGMLALAIRVAAESRTACDAGRRCHWMLWLNPEFGTAWVTWTEGGKDHMERYEPPQRQLFAAARRRPAALERLVKIPFALVAAAAELYADTLAERPPERPPSPTGRRGSATPERTRRVGSTASTLGGGPPGLRRTKARGARPE